MPYYVRTAKRHPWYHDKSEQCETLTKADVQCIITASWTDIATGLHRHCRTHADMAVYDCKPIPENQVTLRFMTASQFQRNK